MAEYEGMGRSLLAHSDEIERYKMTRVEAA